jgi:hypothetical protein
MYQRYVSPKLAGGQDIGDTYLRYMSPAAPYSAAARKVSHWPGSPLS